MMAVNKAIIEKMLKQGFFLALAFIYFTIANISSAHALSYTYCSAPDQSTACFIALEKLKTIKNPLSGKNFFDDGLHYTDGEVFIYPDLHIAETDLDGDGFKEIIVKPPELKEQLEGYFCKPNYICPHFILQDRNTRNKSSIKNIKAMGPIYTFAIGLSTDERVGGFKSLRAYTDTKVKEFNVYQYDKKADDYFNVTAPK